MHSSIVKLSAISNCLLRSKIGPPRCSSASARASSRASVVVRHTDRRHRSAGTADGHQLLVFTCHEHVWRMFQEIKVDCRRIPNRHGEIEEEVHEPQPDPVSEPEPPDVVVKT